MQLLSFHREIERQYRDELSKKFHNTSTLQTSFKLYLDVSLKLKGAEAFIKEIWPREKSLVLAKGLTLVELETESLRLMHFNEHLFAPR